MIADETLPPRVAILGAGRLGGALARALEAAGAEVAVLSGRTTEGAPNAPLLLLTVPDQALGEVAERLARTRTDAPPAVALHLSGALDSSVLAPLARRGFAVGSCHPIQTFPRPDASPDAFAGVTFGVEGEPRAVRAGHALARAVGGRSVEIRAESKPLWHLAAVLAGNGAVALVGAARDAMRAAGLSEREALDALAPLATRSLAGAFEAGPEAALTGPVARGDWSTVEKHREAIDAWDRARRALYDALVEEQKRLVAKRAPLR
jgi:predicted short-subunit dehydrogenase-like oxidoreductase (DUF2520 family)